MSDNPIDTAVDTLTREAEGICQNRNRDFAGTFVAIAPNGEAIHMTLYGNNQDPAYFWSQLITQVQIRLKAIQDAEMLPHGFRR